MHQQREKRPSLSAGLLWSYYTPSCGGSTPPTPRETSRHPSKPVSPPPPPPLPAPPPPATPPSTAMVAHDHGEHDAEVERVSQRGLSEREKYGDETGSGIIEDLSDYGVQNLDEEEEEREGENKGEDGSPDSLVKAIRSLERTINIHCKLLNRKLRRDKPQSKSEHHQHVNRQQPPMMPKPAMNKGDKSHVPGSTAPPGGPMVVYIRVVFLKLGEIDTLKENFAADAFIQARWREPLLDGKTDTYCPDRRALKSLKPDYQNIEDIDWDHYWNPKVYVENNLGEPKETIWQTLLFNKRGEATLYERRRIKGCFLENLELDEFPFDTQDLTLTVTSERSEAEIQLEEDNSEISSINVQSFVDEQEWRLHSHVETWRRVTTRIYQNSKYKHPALSTSCRASRRPGFFIWNIFLVMLFICSLAFATFTVELTLPQNRLQLSFILLLTTITFKFVVSQTLPRISYLTYLDKYILTSMGILCAVCVWHSIAPVLSYNKPLAITADRCAFVLLGSAYIMFHVVFFLYIYFVALKKRWTYNQKDREHKERMRKLQKIQEQEEQKWSNKRIEPI